MTLDDINPFVRCVSLMRWGYMNRHMTVPYDCRVFAISEGEARLSTASGEYSLKRGAVMFFGPAEPYRFINADNDRPFMLLTLNFDLTQERRDIDSFIQPASTETFDPSLISDKQEIPELASPIILSDADELAAKVHDAYDEYQNRREYSKARLSALTTDLLICMVRRAVSGSSGRERLISSIKSFIHDNYPNPINNRVIASELGYHPYYLARVFAESEGISLHRYLSEFRLRSAMQLLRSTTEPIEQIAASCGFATPAHFTAAFKAEYGCVPSDIRRSKR